MADLRGGVTAEHLRESNLIEQIDDPAADATSEQAGDGWPPRRS